MKDGKKEEKKPGIFRRFGGYVVNESGRIINRKQITEGAELIVGLSKNILKKESGRNETFFEAIARTNASPSIVLNNYKIFRKTFFIHMTCAILCMFAMLFFASKGNFVSFLTGIGALSLFVCNAAVFSFRAFQIRKMKLCSFSEWLARSDLWIPKKLDEAKWLIYWKKLERNKNYQIVEIVK